MFRRNISNQYKLSRNLEALSLATTDSSNQIVFNLGTKQVNINVTQPTANRTYTIPDYGADASFVLGSSDANSVNGPASSTDNAIARFDGTGGNTLKNSNLTIDEYGSITPSTNYSANIGTNTKAIGNIYAAVLNASSQVNIYCAADFTTKHVSLRISLYPDSDVTVYVPTTDDTLVGRATTDILTNKTIYSAAFNGTQTGTITHSGQYANTNTTNSTSTSTGAIVTAGGLGVGKDINCAGLFLGTSTKISYYEEYTESISFSGPFSSSKTLAFVRLNKNIFVSSPDLQNTSTSAATFQGTISATRFRPLSTYNYVIGGRDNGTNAILWMSITSAGVIKIGVGATQANFTGSGDCAFWGFNVTYPGV